MRLIVCEAVGYQETLVYWFNVVFAQIEVKGIQVRTVSPEGMMKNARIRDALKLMLAGKLLLHRDTRSAAIYQITQWNPLKTNNKDDILDVLAYAPKVLNLYPTELLLDVTDESISEDFETASFAEDLKIDF